MRIGEDTLAVLDGEVEFEFVVLDVTVIHTALAREGGFLVGVSGVSKSGKLLMLSR